MLARACVGSFLADFAVTWEKTTSAFGPLMWFAEGRAQVPECPLLAQSGR
jgi:hypothetical protein